MNKNPRGGQMFEMVMLTACSGVALCSVCLTVVKRSAQVSRDDAEVLWSMHKQNDLCLARKWKPMKRGKNRIIGFKCECGHMYTQKRPLLSRMPKI
jgi:hypothetical protein